MPFRLLNYFQNFINSCICKIIMHCICDPAYIDNHDDTSRKMPSAFKFVLLSSE